MVGQNVHSANLEQQIAETHEAALSELQQLKDLSREIHLLITESEKKSNP